jgi:hypothetical protein
VVYLGADPARRWSTAAAAEHCCGQPPPVDRGVTLFDRYRPIHVARFEKDRWGLQAYCASTS